MPILIYAFIMFILIEKQKSRCFRRVITSNRWRGSATEESEQRVNVKITLQGREPILWQSQPAAVKVLEEQRSDVL